MSDQADRKDGYAAIRAAKEAASEPTTAHFRIVMPPGLKGTKHAAQGAQIFVTFPGTIVLPGEDFRTIPFPEVPFPATVSVDGHWGVGDVVSLKLEVVGSIEVEYPDEETT